MTALFLLPDGGSDIARLLNASFFMKDDEPPFSRPIFLSSFC
jgi:hypothetical protein